MKLGKKLVFSLIFILGLTTGIFLTAGFDVLPHKAANAAVTDMVNSEKGEAENEPVLQVTQPVDFRNAVKNVLPAVAMIQVVKTVKVTQPAVNDFFDYFFRRDRNSQPKGREYEREQAGMGSGFIISEDGYILTNNHVVGNAKEIRVYLYDKRIYDEAEIIGTDPLTDVALIKLKGDNFPYVNLGDSDKISIGEWVMAIGSPFDSRLSSTVTAGIVSGIGRNLNIIREEGAIAPQGGSYAIESFIQTDAAINPGNSGGPLINIKGEVVGVNTAIISNTGVYEGYGFSIPINLAKRVVSELKEYGEVRRGYMGISMTPIASYDEMKELGVDRMDGAVVRGVTSGSGADKAGIKENDVIIELDGTHIERSSQLQILLTGKHPGDKVAVRVLRDGKPEIFTIELQGRDKLDDKRQYVDNVQPVKGDLGIEIDDLDNYNVSSRFLRKYGGGVIVTDVQIGSIAYEKDIEEGDIIIKIGDRNIRNSRDYSRIIASYKSGETAVFRVYRKGDINQLSIRMP